MSEKKAFKVIQHVGLRKPGKHTGMLVAGEGQKDKDGVHFFTLADVSDNEATARTAVNRWIKLGYVKKYTPVMEDPASLVEEPDGDPAEEKPPKKGQVKLKKPWTVTLAKIKGKSAEDLTLMAAEIAAEHKLEDVVPEDGFESIEEATVFLRQDVKSK